MGVHVEGDRLAVVVRDTVEKQLQNVSSSSIRVTHSRESQELSPSIGLLVEVVSGVVFRVRWELPVVRVVQRKVRVAQDHRDVLLVDQNVVEPNQSPSDPFHGDVVVLLIRKFPKETPRDLPEAVLARSKTIGTKLSDVAVDSRIRRRDRVVIDGKRSILNVRDFHDDMVPVSNVILRIVESVVEVAVIGNESLEVVGKVSSDHDHRLLNGRSSDGHLRDEPDRSVKHMWSGVDVLRGKDAEKVLSWSELTSRDLDRAVVVFSSHSSGSRSG